MMAALRSLLFAALFYPGTFLYCVAAVIAALAGRDATHAVVRSWLNFHCRLCANVLHIRTRVEGTIPPGPCLLAVKHQAMYETMEITRIGGLPVIVLKRELDRIPLFGAVTRLYGSIPVEREAGAKAVRAMVAAGRRIAAEQRSVIIFPEGTRVPVGETPPLRSGFVALYRALGLPVVPIALDSGRVWGRGFVHRPGFVTARVGETIPAGLDRREIERRVHAAINALESGAEGRP